jgi:limonene-1,2-epoxide hydrolase
MVSMRPVRAAALLPAVLVAAVAVAGCGGGSTDRPATTAKRAAPAPQGGRGLDPNILPPRSVPRRPVDAPNPAAVRVIEAWSRDVRRGDFRAAARLFALPARFQNGTPVLTLRRRIDVLAVISGFTCGAVPTRFGAAGGYTLVRFRLTTRVGGDCQGAEGHTTGGAIRVVGGRIRAWYRLFDPEEIAPHAPRADPNGPEV